jgi:hypothetical protein
MEYVLSFAESHLDAICGMASALGLYLLAHVLRWLRSDGATAEQSTLLNTLTRRLQDVSRDWREVWAGSHAGLNGKQVELHEFNSDGLLVAVAVPLTAEFQLSGKPVSELLQPKQRHILAGVMVRRLELIRETHRETELADAIVQARRV